MEALFSQLIAQLNSSVLVLLAILVFAIVAAYKMGSWKQIFLNHSGRINKVERIADTVIAIQTKVDLIYQFSNPNATTRSASPISLTAVGIDIAEKIDANAIFQSHAVKLISKVEARNPKNAYDIQQVSFDVAKRELVPLLSEVELKTIKEEAFNRGILVEDITRIFGILLRNKILESKNIPIAEVDRRTRT